MPNADDENWITDSLKRSVEENRRHLPDGSIRATVSDALEERIHAGSTPAAPIPSTEQTLKRDSPTGVTRTYIAIVAGVLLKKGFDSGTGSAFYIFAAACLVLADFKLPWIAEKAGPGFSRRLNSVAGDVKWWIASLLAVLIFLGAQDSLRTWLAPQSSLPLGQTGASPLTQNLPTSPTGLAPGTIWNNGGVLAVVPDPNVLTSTGTGDEFYDGRPLGVWWKGANLNITAGSDPSFPVSIAGYGFTAKNLGTEEITLVSASLISGLDGNRIPLKVLAYPGGYIDVADAGPAPVGAELQFQAMFSEQAEDLFMRHWGHFFVVIETNNQKIRHEVTQELIRSQIDFNRGPAALPHIAPKKP